jgi:hypothetical protein
MEHVYVVSWAVVAPVFWTQICAAPTSVLCNALLDVSGAE